MSEEDPVKRAGNLIGELIRNLETFEASGASDMSHLNTNITTYNNHIEVLKRILQNKHGETLMRLLEHAKVNPHSRESLSTAKEALRSVQRILK